MNVAEKILALFQALQQSDLDALPPAKRRRFADTLRHWSELADASGRKVEARSGVLDALRHWRGHE